MGAETGIDIAADMAVLRAAGFDAAPTPWMHGTAEILRKDKDETFADYEAWGNWMLAQFDRPCLSGCGDLGKCWNCRLAGWWDAVEIHERAMLYEVMCGVCTTVAEWPSDLQVREFPR